MERKANIWINNNKIIFICHRAHIFRKLNSRIGTDFLIMGSKVDMYSSTDDVTEHETTVSIARISLGYGILFLNMIAN